MSPKSLLRNPLASSPLFRFTDEKFKVVIEERYDNIKPKKVDRVVLCSGKVFYELLTRRQDDQLNNVAILRIEQLYPFPHEALTSEIKNLQMLRILFGVRKSPSIKARGTHLDITL